MKQEILSTILAPLALALMGFVTAAFGYLATYLKAKGSQSKWWHAAAVAGEQVSSIVADIEAVERPKVQQALEDGSLSSDESAVLKRMALDRLKADLPAAIKAELGAVLGDGGVETWLSGLVERAVAGTSSTGTTPTTPPVATAPTAPVVAAPAVLPPPQ